MTRFMNGEEVKIEEKLMTQSSKKLVTWMSREKLLTPVMDEL